jgi:pimeloyl-ACP methyl ester carboxylesterase
VPEGYALAQHPATFAVDVPAFRALLEAVRCPVEIFRGEHDRLVSDAECAALGVPFSVLPGLGHNAHVEAPAGVARLIARLAGRGPTTSEHAS